MQRIKAPAQIRGTILLILIPLSFRGCESASGVPAIDFNQHLLSIIVGACGEIQ
jgi:hypothetical protein